MMATPSIKAFSSFSRRGYKTDWWNTKVKNFFFSAAAEKVLLFGLFYRIFFSRPERDSEEDSPFRQGALIQNFFSWRPECDSEEDSPFQQGGFLHNLLLGGRKVMPKRIVHFSRGLFYRIFFSRRPEGDAE